MGSTRYSPSIFCCAKTGLPAATRPTRGTGRRAADGGGRLGPASAVRVMPRERPASMRIFLRMVLTSQVPSNCMACDAATWRVRRLARQADELPSPTLRAFGYYAAEVASRATTLKSRVLKDRVGSVRSQAASRYDVTPAELVALPKGQAFALLEGGQLWKLRMPLPDPRNDPVMPESLSAIANAMARTYITNEHWYRVPETWWNGIPDVGVPVASESSNG